MASYGQYKWLGVWFSRWINNAKMPISSKETRNVRWPPWYHWWCHVTIFIKQYLQWKQVPGLWTCKNPLGFSKHMYNACCLVGIILWIVVVPNGPECVYHLLGIMWGTVWGQMHNYRNIIIILSFSAHTTNYWFLEN